ncbi:MAG: TolC family protein [Armatimonadota bacterium]|nr:TolC family protein [bacterium]
MLAFAVVFACGACLGDDDALKLSLADAVNKALGSNANLQSARSSRSNSLSSLKIASLRTSLDLGTTSFVERTSYDNSRSSQLFGTVGYENLMGTQASLSLTPMATGDDTNTVSFGLTHPLGKGRGLLSSKADSVLGARSSASIEEKQLYLTTQSTVLGVVETYYSAVLAREQVMVQEQAVAIAKAAADGAKKRAAEGLVAEIEASRAEIRVAQTENELNVQKQNANAALDSLMIAIGSGVGEKPELIEPIPEPESLGEVPGLAAAIENALANRSELAVYDTNLSEQARALAIAKDNLKPGLDLVASFSSSSGDSGLLSRSIWDAGDLTAGLEYTFPLDKRALTEKQHVAENNLEITRKMRVYKMEQIAQEVRIAYRQLQTAKTTVEIYGQNMAVAEDNLHMAQIRVDEGISSNQEVLDAQEALTIVQNSLISAKVSLYLAGVNLKSAMGENLTTMGLK